MQGVWLGIHIIGVIVCFVLMNYVLHTKDTSYKSSLVLTVACGIIIFVARCLYIQADSLDELLAFSGMEYLGKCYADFWLLVFITQYCSGKLPKRFLGLLGGINTVMLVIVLTCKYHHLYYTSIAMKDTPFGYILVLGKAPLYYAYMAFSLFQLLLFLFYCIRPMEKQFLFKNAKMLRILLCTAGIAPIFMISLSISGVTKSVDTTPLGALLTTAILVLAIKYYGLLDTVSDAKDLLVESMDEGIIVSDNNMNFLYANKTACELLPEMGCAEGRTSASEIQALYEQSGTVIDLMDKNYEVRNTEIRDDVQVRGYMISIVDVTDLMTQARIMRELKEKAEHAVAVKSAFLANMSHEIRTPMNAILGMSEMALRGNLDAEEKDYIEQIQAASEGLLTIINDILDFSKMESGKLQIIESEYEVLTMIKDVASLVQGKVKDKGLALGVRVNPNIPRILYGDEIRIKQVLINLVNNAVKFTDEGTITIEADYETDRENALLKISVKDTGMGIKEEDQERIFNSFEQSDTFRNRKKEGSGLGLTISRQLLQLMGGSIQVESVYQEGSCFSVVIPQRIIDSAPCGAYDGPGHRRNKKQEYSKFHAPDANVLIVDDNLVNLRVAAGLMKPFDMQVDTAKSGMEALTKVQEKKYHLIFMDHMMPEMDGIETAHRIRELEDGYYRDIPIIALTANAINGAREMFIEEGLNDFIAKPINMKELSDKILEWLPFELLQE